MGTKMSPSCLVWAAGLARSWRGGWMLAMSPRLWDSRQPRRIFRITRTKGGCFMYSPCLKFLGGFLLLISAAVGLNAQNRELRVCADPNNMPFSARDQAGFENRIAALVAQNLGARLTFVWQRMGRGFVREYLDKAQCDLLIGIPTNYRPVLTTSPYYRSTYVFVSRSDGELKVSSFNAPELHRAGLKIGVQVMDEEYTPPGAALA